MGREKEGSTVDREKLDRALPRYRVGLSSESSDKPQEKAWRRPVAPDTHDRVCYDIL